MNLRQHHLRKHSALLLLVVFVWGGLLGPVVHRASHGMVWADLRGSVSTGSVDACDHDAHASLFEVTVPALHDELCPLCTRHLVTPDGLESPPGSLIGVEAAVSFVSAFAPPPILASHLIRGPPHHA